MREMQKISLTLEKERLKIQIFPREDKAESFLSFPIIAPTQKQTAFLLPMLEGRYIPVNDTKWAKFLLKSSEYELFGSFSIPTWAVSFPNFNLNVTTPTPFGSHIAFEQKSQNLGMRQTAKWKDHNLDRIYEVYLSISKNNSLSSALDYRKMLKERGDFVSLEDKTKSLPDTEKLLGAFHFYVWGDFPLTRYDVLNWNLWVKDLIHAGQSKHLSPLKSVWNALSKESQQSLLQQKKQGYASWYEKMTLMEDIAIVLQDSDFYKPESWKKVKTEPWVSQLLPKLNNLPLHELVKVNKSLLWSAYSKNLRHYSQWGNGASTKIVNKLKESGIDKAWLGVPDWNGGVLNTSFVNSAKKSGFLVGSYDSYHSIHDPDNPGWKTAVFDKKLFETGGIIKKNGEYSSGFKGRGYHLNSKMARPYLEERTRSLIPTVGFNSWFIDCDGAGELFNDYSPNHPMTKEEDMQERQRRLAWIRDEFGVILGTEGGRYYVAKQAHFAHGQLTPPFTWRDNDMKRKELNSPYFMGRYYPPDEPGIMFKKVPIKDKWYRIFYDPTFQLPLFQAAFHDSMIVTHHWGNATTKFSSIQNEVMLREMSYGLPPLLHLNMEEWKKEGKLISNYFKFYSPYLRKIASLPLNEFAWLNPKRTVQKTSFGSVYEVYSNFSNSNYSLKIQEKDVTVPAKSALIFDKKKSSWEIFTPPIRK